MATRALRLGYRLWRLLPGRGQEALVYLGARKVTVGVAAMVEDAEGRLLVLHHTYRTPPWGFPGGLLGGQEQPAEALARELREELGVAASVGPLIHADHEARRRHITLYYRAGIAGTPRHGPETDAHRYVAPADLPALLGPALPRWLREGGPTVATRDRPRR